MLNLPIRPLEDVWASINPGRTAVPSKPINGVERFNQLLAPSRCFRGQESGGLDSDSLRNAVVGVYRDDFAVLENRFCRAVVKARIDSCIEGARRIQTNRKDEIERKPEVPRGMTESSGVDHDWVLYIRHEPLGSGRGMP